MPAWSPNRMRSPLTVLSTIVLVTLSFSSGTLSAQDALPEVELETSEGNIVIELNAAKAPKTVANFLEYMNSGYFEGTVFHRVIKDFMIQGGGLDQNLVKKKTQPPVPNEAGNGLPNKKYSVAMARTARPDSATSQFFINTKDNPSLDRNQAAGSAGYTVFGRVVKGLDVVDRIAAAETTSKPDPTQPSVRMNDVPVKPIVIKKVSIRSKD
jgi:peptidyl-prolyl cis-trans isomerase A (cyclophilin A)